MGNLTPDLIFPLYTFKTRQVTWTQASTATLNNSEQAMTCWCVCVGPCVSLCVCVSQLCFQVCLCILGQHFSSVWKWILPQWFPLSSWRNPVSYLGSAYRCLTKSGRTEKSLRVFLTAFSYKSQFIHLLIPICDSLCLLLFFSTCPEEMRFCFCVCDLHHVRAAAMHELICI